MAYWTQLWPAARALAEALPERLDGRRVVEVGAGLGLPAFVAAARGAEVTAFDHAAAAVELLRENAARNGLQITVEVADWNAFAGEFDLVLAADVLYEQADVDTLLEALPRLGGEILLADSLPVGMIADFAGWFLQRCAGQWQIDEVAERVWRLSAR